MAGDWIKMRTDLQEDPAMFKLRTVTKLDRHAVVGRLYAFWCWADKHAVDGRVDGATSTAVDEVVQCDGFAAAMQAVKWLEIGEDHIAIPNHDRHNGESAKERSLKNQRQARWRDGRRHSVSTVDESSSTSPSTREEKRRVKNKTAPPEGGSTIWDFGRSLLIEQGLSAQSAGALMGSWLREWAEPDVAEALRLAAGKADIRSYAAAILKAKPKKAVGPQAKVVAL